MTKYVACFIVIISLLGQSLLLSASAEPSFGNGTDVSAVMQKQTMSFYASSHQDTNAHSTSVKQVVKTDKISQCEEHLSQCAQLDSGHCTAHSYCHTGALLPMTLFISSVVFAKPIMTSRWSSKTISSLQDFRPPIV
ncbi:hypothetical protein [uncultured Shewanella sp.]|uniref:hypothetical protein n=1 Tax=uncultured Shewanella sp. TaxID=173975 RepID=UPI002614F67B|nr:hypothetical protein [uncultured Shewanella sp.]